MFENLLAKRRTVDPHEHDFFTALQRDVNRAFEGVFRDGGPFEARGTQTFIPRIEVTENPEGYEMSAELPGMTEKDVHCHVTGNLLMLEGEKRTEKTEKSGKADAGKGWHYTERTYGAFQRAFTLPTEVDAEHITAHFKNGVLSVRLPKTQKAVEATRQIRITSQA